MRQPDVLPAWDVVAVSALLTLDDVAARLAVCPRTVRTLVRAGQIAHVRVGRQIRVRPEDLDAYLTEARVPTEAERRRAAVRSLPSAPAPLPAGYWRR